MRWASVLLLGMIGMAFSPQELAKALAQEARADGRDAPKGWVSPRAPAPRLSEDRPGLENFKRSEFMRIFEEHLREREAKPAPYDNPYLRGATEPRNESPPPYVNPWHDPGMDRWYSGR